MIAGYTYCATAALSLLDRLPEPTSKTSSSVSNLEKPPKKLRGLTNLSATIQWLLSRQVEYSDADDEAHSQESEIHHIADNRHSYSDLPSLAGLSIHQHCIVGLNGRVNKASDTCYCFWVPGTLEVYIRLPVLSSVTNELSSLVTGNLSILLRFAASFSRKPNI